MHAANRMMTAEEWDALDKAIERAEPEAREALRRLKVMTAVQSAAMLSIEVNLAYLAGRFMSRLPPEARDREMRRMALAMDALLDQHGGQLGVQIVEFSRQAQDQFIEIVRAYSGDDEP